MKNALFFILFILIVLKSTITIACSVFNITTDNNVLAGRNHDRYDETGTIKYLIELSPASEGKNGTFFCIVENMNNYAPAEGINDKGLFMGLASVPKTTIINDYSKTGVYDDYTARIILEKCSTVDEAIKELRKYNVYFNPSYPTHYMIADPTGRSVVIEYVNKEMRVIEKKGNSQYIANAYLSDVKLKDVPSWAADNRYSVLEYYLKDKNKLNIDDGFLLLSLVAQGKSTQTSTVYDLQKKEITIVWQKQYNKKIKFNLSEELKKGLRIKEISSLNINDRPEVFDPTITKVNNTISVTTKSELSIYENSWPAFSINYPADWIEKNPDSDMVFRIEAITGMPFLQIGVFANMNFPLIYSSRIYHKELVKRGSDIKLIYDNGILLKDGTPAQESEFSYISNTGKKLNLYFLTAKKENHWILILISNDKGKTGKQLKDIAYSFEMQGEDKPADLPDDIKKHISKIESDVMSHDINGLMQNFSDKFLNNGSSKPEFEAALKMMLQDIEFFRIVITKIKVLDNKVNVAGFMNVNNINKTFYSDTYIKENGQWKSCGNQKPKQI
jgi:predicted choloylglycine hydrolase